MHIFELGMLVCFGLSWPISIIRSYRSRSTKGKSVIFSFVIVLGYICGIINKLMYSRDFVLYVYFLNITLVIIDICLWFRNRRLEKAEESGKRA